MWWNIVTFIKWSLLSSPREAVLTPSTLVWPEEDTWFPWCSPPANPQPHPNLEKNMKQSQIEPYTTKCLTALFQFQDHERKDWEPQLRWKRHYDLMHYGILDLILKQEKGHSRKTGEIQMKSVVYFFFFLIGILNFDKWTVVMFIVGQAGWRKLWTSL